MPPSALAPGDLCVRDVAVQAGGRAILQDIELRLVPGELCALIGPSGAGKSTLMKVLLGLRRPARGGVTLGDGAVGASGPVGYVPQDDALHRSLKVGQALDFAARLRLPALADAARQQALDRVVAQVGLGDRLDVKIGRLSGGQRKRVSVAMELLTEPPLLILDEPTSGLDPGLEARMMGLFDDLARAGRIVLVATHAMQSLDRCGALLVLVAGRVAWFGPPAHALAWFEVQTYAGIFDRLQRHAPPVWGRRFMASPERARFLARPGPGLAPVLARAPGTVAAPAREGPTPQERLAALKAERAQKGVP